MDEIPGCKAQLLEVGIPWSQDFLASFFRLHLTLIPSPLKIQLQTQQLYVSKFPAALIAKDQDSDISHIFGHLAAVLQTHWQEDSLATLGRGLQRAMGNCRGQ